MKVPKGVSANKQLIYVDSKQDETEHTVTFQRTGKRTTEVTIVDSALVRKANDPPGRVVRG